MVKIRCKILCPAEEDQSFRFPLFPVSRSELKHFTCWFTKQQQQFQIKSFDSALLYFTGSVTTSYITHTFLF